MILKVTLMLLATVLLQQQILADFILPMPVTSAELSSAETTLRRAKRSHTTICVEIRPSSPREEPYLMCKGANFPTHQQKESPSDLPSSYGDNQPSPSSSSGGSSALRPTIINTKTTADSYSAGSNFQNPADSQFFTQENIFIAPMPQSKAGGFQNSETFNTDYKQQQHPQEQQQPHQQQLPLPQTPAQSFQFQKSTPTSFFHAHEVDTKATQFGKSPQYDESFNIEEEGPQHYSGFATKTNTASTQANQFKQIPSAESYHSASSSVKTSSNYGQTFQSTDAHANPSATTFNGYQSPSSVQSKSFSAGPYSQSAFAATATNAYDAKSPALKTVPSEAAIATSTASLQPTNGAAAAATSGTYVVPTAATKTSSFLDHFDDNTQDLTRPQNNGAFSYLPPTRGAQQHTPHNSYSPNVQPPIRTLPHTLHPANTALNNPPLFRGLFQTATKIQQPTGTPFQYLPPLTSLAQTSANVKTTPTAAADRYRAAFDDEVFDVPNWGFSADEFNLFRPMSAAEPIVSMRAPQRPQARTRPTQRLVAQRPSKLQLFPPAARSNIPLEHLNDPVMQQFYASLQDTGKLQPRIQSSEREPILGAGYGEPEETPQSLSQLYPQQQPLPQSQTYVQPQRIFNSPPASTPNQCPLATPIYVQSAPPTRCSSQPPITYIVAPNEEFNYGGTKGGASTCGSSVVREHNIQPILIAIPCYGQQPNAPQAFAGAKPASYETVGMGNPLFPPAPLFPMAGLRNPLANLLGPPGLFPLLGSPNPSADRFPGATQSAFQGMPNPFAFYALNPLPAMQTTEMRAEDRVANEQQGNKSPVFVSKRPAAMKTTTGKTTTESEELSEEDDEEETEKTAKNESETDSEEAVGASKVTNTDVNTNTTTSSVSTSTEASAKKIVGATAETVELPKKKEENTENSFKGIFTVAKKMADLSNKSQAKTENEEAGSSDSKKFAGFGAISDSGSPSTSASSSAVRIDKRQKRKYMQQL